MAPEDEEVLKWFGIGGAIVGAILAFILVSDVFDNIIIFFLLLFMVIGAAMGGFIGAVLGVLIISWKEVLGFVITAALAIAGISILLFLLSQIIPI